MIKLRHLLSEIYISGFTSSDGKSKFHRPENFDKMDDGAGWQVYAGGNDWENGITACCMYFGNGEEHGRVWFHVKFPEGICASSSEGGDGNRDRAKEWGDKAYKTWLKETKKVHKESKHKVNPDDPDGKWFYKDWKECFIEALMAKDMKQFIKDAGVDSTHWKAMKISKELNEDKSQEADRLTALAANGHGRWIGSCGHVIKQCRCKHGKELEFHTLSPCSACMKKH